MPSHAKHTKRLDGLSYVTTRSAFRQDSHRPTIDERFAWSNGLVFPLLTLSPDSERFMPSKRGDSVSPLINQFGMAQHADGPPAPDRINGEHQNLSMASRAAYGLCVNVLHDSAQTYFLPFLVFSIACLTCSITVAAFSFTDCSLALASK